MNFSMNHTLISLNTTPTPKNIFLMIIEMHILIIWNVSYKSSSNSPSVQVLHQQIRGGSQFVLFLLSVRSKIKWKLADMILGCSQAYILVSELLYSPDSFCLAWSRASTREATRAAGDQELPLAGEQGLHHPCLWLDHWPQGCRVSQVGTKISGQ